MARCAKCNTEIPDEIRHYFCGYGWYAQFCAACCPRKMDGTECDDEHPDADLDTLIDSITEHSGPAHILPGPHVEEIVREVVAAEDMEAGDAVYLKPDVNDETRRRRERYGMLGEDLFREEMKAPIVPGSPAYEAIRTWLKSYNEMVRWMIGTLRESAPEPSKAEDESEGKDAPSGSWRDRPPLL
jgi:hypothetical protein